MTKLVLALANKGIEVKARQNDKGQIIGLSFKADYGPFLAASRVKKSRLTFSNLQRKEGVSYVPERDNAAFGIGNKKLKLTISVDITEVQFAKIKMTKSKVKVRRRNNGKLSASFTFCNSKRAREIMIMSQGVMAMLRALFGSDRDFEWEQKEYNDYLYQNSVDYNLSDEVDTLNELKAEHEKWIGSTVGTETEFIYSELAA